MYCCTNCFTHTFLKDYIQNSSSNYGKCSFCNNKKKSPVFDAELLIDLFQSLIDLYAEKRGGQPLNDLLQEDWNVFSKDVDKKNQIKLLSKMTKIRGLNSKKYTPVFASNNGFKDKWDAFTNELKHENRFFPKNNIDTDQLSELFNYLIMPKDQKPEYVFRARINHELKKLLLKEMGKPPVDKSTDGRANPKGISYFYGSSDEKTAISETRPHKTETLCVAKFKVSPKISLIDLRNPKSTISPFGLDDDNLILLYTEHMPILVHLRDTLSKPVLPHKKELEYLSTQYLCELIKDNNFGGISFKSSLDKGDNYVIFDDSYLKGNRVDNYIVTETIVNSIKK